jgi:drug/metabolite transporter, DME family
MANSEAGPEAMLAAAGHDSWTLGTTCGLLSALAYTAANLCLRSVAHCDPAWVSCVKSTPTSLVMLPWMLLHYCRGQTVWPAPRGIGLLIIAALIGQFGGNVLFQWSLGVIGLAFTVPLTTAATIFTGAVLGRVVQGESITGRTLFCMLMLIAATCVLSLGAGNVQSHLPALQPTLDSFGGLQTTAGVAAAILSGMAYAVLGVSIRRVVSRKTPIASVLFVVATVGVVAVGSFAYSRIGLEGISNTSLRDYGGMALAGICNTAAFICLTVALRETSITYVNNLSATQTAIASLLGVILFSEPMSGSLVSGVTMTVLALILLPSRRPSWRNGKRAGSQKGAE